MKKLFKELLFFFLWLMNYNYIVNLKTKEIHRITSKDARCNLLSIKKWKAINEDQIHSYIKKDEYNGCCHCLKERDTDLKIFVV